MQPSYTAFETLVGQGRLHVNGQDFGSVTYSVRLSADDTGDGVLSGNECGLAAAAAYGAVSLALENGDVIDIHVHAANLARGLFIVSQPIPEL